MIFRGTAFLLLVAACVAVGRWISEPSHSSFARGWEPRRSPDLTVNSPDLGIRQAPQIQSQNRRLVYPYSVVPGGVASGDELRAVAAHDATVARHYSGFDYKRARIVRVKRPELVYLSYRKGNRIFWTRRQASLHVGEALLTDGSITARTRCGNQVSVLPQAATSPEEPTMAELDRPDAAASGIESIPSNLVSSLHVDPVMPFGHSPGGGPGGGAPGASLPPPIGTPTGGGGLPGGGGTGGSPGGGTGGGPGGGGGTPPPVPEPGTLVLVASGAAAILARARHRG